MTYLNPLEKHLSDRQRAIVQLLKPEFPFGLSRKDIMSILGIKTQTQFQSNLRSLRRKKLINLIKYSHRRCVYAYRPDGATAGDQGLKYKNNSSPEKPVLGTRIGIGKYAPFPKKHSYIYKKWNWLCGYCLKKFSRLASGTNKSTGTHKFCAHLIRCREKDEKVQRDKRFWAAYHRYHVSQIQPPISEGMARPIIQEI